jgi:hypothetical protein
MAEVLVRSWLRITLGYAFSITPEKSTGASVFNPRAASDCADAQGNLATVACTERLAGQARPTAAGTYSARSTWHAAVTPLLRPRLSLARRSGRLGRTLGWTGSRRAEP